MIKFYDDNIIVGYIKQLLHSFNLPKVKVFKEDEEPINSTLYIKDDYIQMYDKDGKWNKIVPYVFGNKYTNYTKNLKLDSLNYDSYTHKYLGEYLRFIRDYKNVNLMSLYNCYNNETANNLTEMIAVRNSQISAIESNSRAADELTTIEFSGNSINSKILMVPVKFGKTYTIAFECEADFNLFCGYYSKKYYRINDDLPKITYQRHSPTRFGQPFTFTVPKISNSSQAQHEESLKLFIEIPLYNESSLVVLEGVYLNSNITMYKRATFIEDWEAKYPADPYIPSPEDEWIETGEANVNAIPEDSKWITYQYEQIGIKAAVSDLSVADINLPVTFKQVFNYEKGVDNSKLDINNNSQLLYINTKESYPFANRLIEYLTNNAITNSEEISDNIKRVQKALQRKNINTQIPYYGVWDSNYKPLIYEIAQKENLLKTSFDTLGYVDKDVERRLGSDVDIYGGE